MNRTVVVVFGTMATAAVYWIGWARHFFQGPPRYENAVAKPKAYHDIEKIDQDTSCSSEV